MHISDIPIELIKTFRDGCVIPAQPLALDENRKFDKHHQKALTRYYIDAGVGGIAVGVHSTQFEIRDPDVNLFEDVLELASYTIDEHCANNNKQILKIAGVCGSTTQAINETRIAKKHGYHACLLSLGALSNEDIPNLLQHCQTVAEEMPLIGFYLQPSVGGRSLPFHFWRGFADIENVLGIKMAPFNRYQTLDVVRAVAEAGRGDTQGGNSPITLYTGNDDNIIVDLLSPYQIELPTGSVTLHIRGGLLGHWCVWTHKAVNLLNEIHDITNNNKDIPTELLIRNIQVTDANAALFDTANSFHGCIPGIHEVLRRQGLLKGIWCLNPDEVLSPGQADELTRVHNAYPHLHDDDFVSAHLKEWLA